MTTYLCARYWTWGLNYIISVLPAAFVVIYIITLILQKRKLRLTEFK